MASSVTSSYVTAGELQPGSAATVTTKSSRLGNEDTTEFMEIELTSTLPPTTVPGLFGQLGEAVSETTDSPSTAATIQGETTTANFQQTVMESNIVGEETLDSLIVNISKGSDTPLSAGSTEFLEETSTLAIENPVSQTLSARTQTRLSTSIAIAESESTSVTEPYFSTEAEAAGIVVSTAVDETTVQAESESRSSLSLENSIAHIRAQRDVLSAQNKLAMWFKKGDTGYILNKIQLQFQYDNNSEFQIYNFTHFLVRNESEAKMVPSEKCYIEWISNRRRTSKIRRFCRQNRGDSTPILLID